jgi:hypothetical protein
MAGRSKVRALDPELKAELDRLLREDSFTLDEVLTHLRRLAKDPAELPSRSAVGRYAQKFQAITERVRRSQEIADRLVAECGPQIADGKGLQVLVQGFQSLAFDLLANIGEDETLDPENLSFLARAISDVARAQKTDADRALRIRQETAKSAAAKAAEVAKARGISAETVDQIRKAVLGVAE